ncbi:NAD(P)-dependent oxidoreductase [Mycetocola sp. JXN-3]|uniref:NAD-dependent epimerase/dehydratase family protein n=1 Tax=Mycetocola sp. JXN-3 TaxID=2116510 RepID=UPI00165D198F|nr:NAD(P)-dependent oxidoreductase [Mycetocola sp. JXN-3]
MNTISLTLVITGAAGGIGGPVARAALDAGYRVIAADQAPFELPGAAATLVGDLRDQAVVDAVFDAAGPDVYAVLHLAAIPSPGQFDDHDTLVRNVSSAYRVIGKAGERGVRRIVAVSSASAVGFAWADRDLTPDYLPVDEDHPIVAVDTYGLSKVFMEQIAAFTHRRWQVPTITLRFPFVGTGERLRYRLDEMAQSPATGSRDLWAWLDTRDAVTAILRSAEVPFEGSAVLNISAPDTMSPWPTREIVAAAFPGLAVPERVAEYGGLYDTTRAADLLGLTEYHGWRAGA